jgi:signal peptidase II
MLGLGAFLLVADQVSKALVAARIGIGEQVNVIGSYVQLWHLENSGAAFSLLQNGLPLFLAVSVVALGLVAYFARALAGRSLWFFVILGLVLGGTLGNFTDRVLRGGRVIDFLSVGIGDLRWPTFNVADSSLVVGILALAVSLWFFEREADGAHGGGRDGDPGEGRPVAQPAPGGGDPPRGGGGG